MASLAATIGEALEHYWLSPLALTVLAICGASIATLLYVFLTNARNTKLRVSLLTGLYALSSNRTMPSPWRSGERTGACSSRGVS
ncbi:MAG: hypothetical protein E6K01_02970 [Methanobacteriota archaeon]|nr:MAG: hypothetical protein E6K01_02970 [Euryarchaeota archaeon]